MIIGAGPAGLFAGYLLAQHGYRPLILERGRAVKDRVADVRRFDAGGPLDPESNYLFGEGGAGTFSDGKLTSRNTGPDVRRVLEILADCHGKPSIVYEHRPHLGSNPHACAGTTSRQASKLVTTRQARFIDGSGRETTAVCHRPLRPFATACRANAHRPPHHAMLPALRPVTARAAGQAGKPDWR